MEATKADYTIISDGACSGNPGPMSGSYQIETRTGNRRIERCHFGRGTNNVAQYMTMIVALGDIIAKCQHAGLSPAAFTIQCLTDSQLVVKQVNGEWGCRDEALSELHGRTVEHLKMFKQWSVKWQPREQIVKVLGH
jgi:ribonuclease HI